MKKLVSVLFALLLVGSFAFAQDEAAVKVGSWSRFIFVPAASFDGGDNFATSGPSWANGSRIGVGFSGTSEKAGFNLDLHSNGNEFAVGDQAKIWISPIPMLKIQGGKVQEDTLRGKFDDSNILNGMEGVFSGVPGKNAYFTRFYPKLGVVVSLTPAEGVFLGMSLDASSVDGPDAVTVSIDTDGDGTITAAEEYDTAEKEKVAILTEDMLKKIQIGGGYVIPNMGHARVQYIGNVDDAPKFMEAAFAYTAMEGVLVDAGLKFNTEADTAQNVFSAAGSYSTDALSALVRAQVTFGDDGTSDELGYSASVDLSYVVADPVAVGIEAAYAKRDDPTTITVLPYLQVGSGKGKLKTGFGYETKTDDPLLGDYSTWAIPVMIEVGF